MPPIDWIHVAMFIGGLFVNYLATRPAAPSVPMPTPADPGTSRPLLDLLHKLIPNGAPQVVPTTNPNTAALEGIAHKLLDILSSTAVPNVQPVTPTK